MENNDSLDGLSKVLSGMPTLNYIEWNGIKFTIQDSKKFKKCFASDRSYNSIFNKETGEFARWGKTISDDPQMCLAGPEILDCEISIGGCPSKCPFCYKNNTNESPTNMTFETFKKILDKFPKTLTQVALGICGVQTNPWFFEIMEYCRNQGVIPNYTLTGIDLTDELAKRTAELCGAVAVSVHSWEKDLGYNTVKRLTDLGMKQINIHAMTSMETLPFIYEVLEDIKTDKRLEKLNAIVFLGLKPKGRAKTGFNILNNINFKKLVEHCLKNNIPFGFDSCSAPKFEKTIDEMTDISNEQRTMYKASSESCESGLFSSYINVNAFMFPCSFSENENDWKEGIDVLSIEDFTKDVWHCDKMEKWRKQLLNNCINGCRRCIQFPEINP